jgi:hypothetical protein
MYLYEFSACTAEDEEDYWYLVSSISLENFTMKL